MINILNKLYQGKWMMEKKSLFNFYNAINKIADINKQEYTVNMDAPTSPMENEPDGDICIIHISGIMVKGASMEEEIILGMVNTDEISNQLDEAAQDPSIKAIILDWASPGGETTGITELGRKVKYIDENIKPVYSWIEKQMASAAAWVGAQARAIGMTESANVGSCGVYMIVVDASKQYEQQGLNHQIISSGKYKMMGHDVKPLTEEENDILIQDVEEQHTKFKDAIKSNRPKIKDEALEGLSYEGPEALDNGWVDYQCDSLKEFLETVGLL